MVSYGEDYQVSIWVERQEPSEGHFHEIYKSFGGDCHARTSCLSLLVGLHLEEQKVIAAFVCSTRPLVPVVWQHRIPVVTVIDGLREHFNRERKLTAYL